MQLLSSLYANPAEVIWFSHLNSPESWIQILKSVDQRSYCKCDINLRENFKSDLQAVSLGWTNACTSFKWRFIMLLDRNPIYVPVWITAEKRKMWHFKHTINMIKRLDLIGYSETKQEHFLFNFPNLKINVCFVLFYGLLISEKSGFLGSKSAP